MKLRTKFFLSLFLIAVISVGSYQFLMSGWLTGYEGQGVYLYGYDASTYDSTYADPQNKVFEGTPTRIFIDPDGHIVMGTLLPQRGQGTGLQVEIDEPGPVNYQDNQYRRVADWEDWRPSEEWAVTIDGQDWQVDVYRLMFGLTITTATSRPDKGKSETDPISNLKLHLRVHLPTWKGVEEANIVIGSIFIPNIVETRDTIKLPVTTEVLGYKKKGFFDKLSTLGLDIDVMPYIAPMSPGTYFWGKEFREGSTPPSESFDTVTIPIEWASIKPGVEAVSILETRRLEITESLLICITFMASRPLFAPTGEPGTDPATGGEQLPPIECGLFEKPIKDKNGKTLYCERDQTLRNLFILVAVVVVILVVLLGLGLIKYLI